MPVRFVNGQFVTVPDERHVPSESEVLEVQANESHSNETRSDDILDVLARVQRDITNCERDRAQALKAANEARLMIFPEIPSESKLKVQFIITEELQKENGLERVERYLKYLREITSMTSNMIEDWRSKASVKIKIKNDNDTAFTQVQKVREQGNKAPRKGPARYTKEERVIANFVRDKRVAGLGVKRIAAMIQAINPAITYDAVETFIHKYIAGKMGLKSGDKNPKLES